MKNIHLSTYFVIQKILDTEADMLVMNMTDSSPAFLAHPLEPGVTYEAIVIAYNSKGKSEPVKLHISTLKEAAMHKSELKQLNINHVNRNKMLCTQSY